ncbi:hypothetical protein TNCV_537091 [Trichonephila clavipes]|nr:hypothetical protein TNCV_537091 [Trichonephila clavipes]
MFVFFRGAVGDKFVFMDDNATCHRTLAVQDCLDSEGIQRLVWPARSPDLNPIENVWDALGRQVAGRNYPPTNKNTLVCLHLATGRTRDDREKDLATTEEKEVGTREKRGVKKKKSRGREK